MKRYDAVLFDLLTALLDSWTLWNDVAGSEADGRAWRAAYLRITYGCGEYRPYETLVAEAAASCGLSASLARSLDERWDELRPWPDAPALLEALSHDHRLGVVTNCSERLGQRAAARLGVPLDCVITAERAGAYKPEPAPYRMALDALGLPAARVLFVAGSAFDLFGTARVGLPTVWHNRVGLALPAEAPAPLRQAPTLEPLLAPLLDGSGQMTTS
ncbi:MAG: HAD-IA family hydrolase [Gammaproteobacteria bacterium]|nr:HAD-IA family hydrolase [Gammaproteobacteria bacterium]